MRMSGPILVVSSLLFVLFLVLYLLGGDRIPSAEDLARKASPSTIGERDRIRQLLSGEFKREPKKNVALGEGRLRCIVRDSEGAPAPGTNVQVTPIASDADILKARPEYRNYWELGVSAAATVEFRTLPAGRYLVIASRDGAHGLAEVEVVENGAFAESELVLAPAAPRRGVVKDRQGAPLAGAVVVPLRAGDWVGDSRAYRHLPVETDASGAFDHPLLPSGDWEMLVAAKDHAPQIVVVPDGPGAVIKLGTGAAFVAEIVRAPDSRPLSNVKVWLQADDGPEEGYTARTNGQGLVSFERLRPATYHLSLLNDGYTGALEVPVAAQASAIATPATPESKNMRVDPLSGTAIVTTGSAGAAAPMAPALSAAAHVQLVAQSAGSVRGRVLAANAAIGIGGVEIAAYQAGSREPSTTTTSDQAGYYHLKPLTAGSYEIVVPRRDGATFAASGPTQVAVAEGAQSSGPEFHGVPGVSLSGQVLDDSGRPVPEANIAVEIENVPGAILHFGSDSAGAFRIDGMHAVDQVRLWAVKMGRQSPEFGPVTIGPNGLGEILLRIGEL